MQVTSSTSTRSVTARARRAQIVEATIETIADVGYAQASFARIAARAGLSSTRLISYHFADKRELMAQTASSVYEDIAAVMTERLSGVASAAGALRAYIEGTIEYVARHRAQMAALLDIFLSGVLTDGAQAGVDKPQSGEPDAERPVELVALDALERILRDGQASGEFRDFDPVVVAACIQRSLDGVPMLLRSRPDLDLDVTAREIASLYERATRADGH